MPVTNHMISHATLTNHLTSVEPAQPWGREEGSDEQMAEEVLAKVRAVLLNLIQSHAVCSVCAYWWVLERRGEIDPLGQAWLVYHLLGSSRRHALNDYGPCLIHGSFLLLAHLSTSVVWWVWTLLRTGYISQSPDCVAMVLKIFSFASKVLEIIKEKLWYDLFL